MTRPGEEAGDAEAAVEVCRFVAGWDFGSLAVEVLGLLEIFCAMLGMVGSGELGIGANVLHCC